MPVESSSQAENAVHGILLKVASVAIFVMMNGLIKVAGDVPAGQIVFFRSLFAIPPIMLVLWLQGQMKGAWRTKNPVGHIMRGLVGVSSMGLGFFALTRLPLPDAITLNYAQPLLVVVFSALFMGELIRVYRWSAVIVGLFGVVVVSWPKLTLFSSGAPAEAGQAIGVLAAFGGATMSAIAMLLVRKLVHTERTSTIVIWFSASATVISLFTIPFGWNALEPYQVASLIGAGVCGGLAQILMTEAYRYAEASVVAPFEYTSLLLGIIFAYLVFGELPTIYTLVGGAIVISAGIFIVVRERQLGLERAKAKKVSPPQ